MADPVISTSAKAGLTVFGVSLAGLMPQIDSGVLVAATFGALIFVLTNKEYSLLTRWLLLLPSIAAGVTAAPFTSSLITAITPDSVEAKMPIGALVASAVVVKVLMTFANDPGAVFRALFSSVSNLFKGGGNAK
ncbi:putative holin [Klebsiella aerogenes]|uniref:Uncharacterized protein n=1 Tax=Klebsiella aerogenes TaxID=548 RepID=A0AAP9U5L7_KLEAE|nr:putative holin [Klebsiella aerogenes]QMR40325.1 hypothetical protein HV331_12900 [Klebsiella aerogenes]